MVATAVGEDQLEPPATGCWCCGDRTVRASLLRLGEHPEVGVCFRCVRVLAGLRRRESSGSAGNPWWSLVGPPVGGLPT